MKTFSEYNNVEKPLINTLTRLGWGFIPADEVEKLRETYDNFFITPHLKDAILKLNRHKGITEDHANAIINRLKRVDDNEEFNCWIKGERSYKPSPDAQSITIDLIDYETIENNTFIVTNQYTCTITNPVNTKDKHIRPDVVLLVNGLPLSIIECKVLSTEGSNYQEGLKQLKRYQQVCPELFIPNVFNISTDGFIFKYGATASPAKYFSEWKDDTDFPDELKEDSEFKKYAEENKKDFNPYIDVQVFGLLNRANYLDIINNFVVFETRENETVKKITRYQQYRAANKIVKRVLEGDMKTGLVWHTQGSGKSLTMLFTAWKLRKQQELKNPTIIVVVDRIDLDEQITGTFQAVKLPNTSSAFSTEALREKLKQDKREVIITTVFKFNDMKDLLIERDNIILLIDEAHRTQEGINAAEMRRSLKNAYFFGFTGTPIDKSDTNTHRNFGMQKDNTIERYLDLYNIKQAIDDGATVPVHYQLRNTKWHLTDTEIDSVVEEEYSFLEEEEVDTLKQKASRFSTFMMKPERLEAIAFDIKEHFTNHIEPNGFKAQVVCYNRDCCVTIKEHLDKILGTQYSEIVFSGGQNDDKRLRKYHKTKEEVKTTTDNFKDSGHPLRILIVQSMLLTGFDAPVEQVMYLDRPLKDHSLLQAIARTNRPYDNKKCGMIIDYCGVLKNLNKALNFNESDIEKCLIDFDQLKRELPDYLEQFKRLFAGIEKSNLAQCLMHIDQNELDKDIREIYRNIQLIYETLCPDPFVLDYLDDYKWATQIVMARSQQLNQKKPDISDYLAHTRELIQDSIDLDNINKVAPVFVVDDNYLKKLDGTALNPNEREKTIEHRLRTVLTTKIGDLPVYKSLLERLENIIEQKNQDSRHTLALLEKLTEDTNEAIKQDEALGDTKGQRAISQIIRNKTQDENIVKEMTGLIHSTILKHTENFKGWQQQLTVKSRVKRDIIIFLATYSRDNDEFKIEPEEYTPFTEELIKYIEKYY